jgi:DNA mismatch repair protein MutL
LPKIQRLPDEVASRIAAGEVIERPASLLKELLENALDAGASKVSVEAAGAGRKVLRVVDDGGGMDKDDVALALERHATSKIGRLDDLQTLRTFGFRGEALYAAAAVSKLSLTSTQRGARTGWRVESVGGKVVKSGPAPAVPGTTVEAAELFFNTPARLKFLKSDAFEKSKLAAVIEEAALANPEVAFSYKSEGRQALRFAAEAGRDPVEGERRRVEAVLGSDLGKDLLSVVGDRPGYKLRLWVSRPGSLAATRHYQWFFVNRRPVESRLLQQALYRAYDEHRPREKHPVCVGYLELSPDSFDVNVHPGKREVRFHKDRDIFELVSGLVASALAREKRPSPITSEAVAEARSVSVAAPAATTVLAEAPQPYYLGGRSFFPEEPAFALQTRPAEALERPKNAPAWWTPPFRFVGQIEKSFLLFEASGGLFILDQHAAAERILFEKLLDEIDDGGVRSQKLLLPLPVELTASSLQRVLEHTKDLSKLGFEVKPFGKATLHITAAPALFKDAADLKELAQRLVESFADASTAAREVKHHAVSTVACKAAVKAHDRLSEREALALLEQLKDCRDGSCCPHGRRAMLALSREELARRFQRPGAVPL